MSANEFYASAPQGTRDSNGPQDAHRQDTNQNGPQAADGERGFLSTVAGGAAGAYAGGKLGGNHSTLGKIAGGLMGAIAANKLEDKFKGHSFGGHGHGRGIEHGPDGPGGPGGYPQGGPGYQQGPGGYQQGPGGYQQGPGGYGQPGPGGRW